MPVASTCRSPTLPLTLRLWGDGIRRIVTLAAIIIPGILSKFIQLRIHNNMYVISVVVYRNIPASCRVRLWASVAKRNGVADCGLETPRAAAGGVCPGRVQKGSIVYFVIPMDSFAMERTIDDHTGNRPSRS